MTPLHYSEKVFGVLNLKHSDTYTVSRSNLVTDEPFNTRESEAMAKQRFTCRGH